MESSRWWRPLAIASSTAEDVAAAVESLGPAYKGYARKVIEQAIDGPCIHQLFEESREFRAEDPRYLDRLIEDALGVSSRIHRLKILGLFRNIYDQERAVRDFHMRLDVFRNNMTLCWLHHPLLSCSGAAACLLILCSGLRSWGPCCRSA